MGGSEVTKRLTVAGVVVLLTMNAAAAIASHSTETVYIHTGVSSEEEARTYPCAPAADAQGWERSGPVVCLARVADTWDLHYEIPDSRGCSYTATGWSGSCVFDIDMGDHIRVWGTSGIQMTTVTVDWGHGAPADDETETSDGDPDTDTGTGDDGGTSGGEDGGRSNGPTGPSAPEQPDAPTGPSGPSAPAGPTDTTGSTGAYGLPSQPSSPAPHGSSGGSADPPTAARQDASGTVGLSSTDGSTGDLGDATADDGETVPANDRDGDDHRGGALGVAVLILAVAGGSLLRVLRRPR